MLADNFRAEVFISGASISGLIMAAQLICNGLTPIIIDAKNDDVPILDLITLDSKSLEILDQLGLISEIISDGILINEVIIYQDEKPIPIVDLGQIKHTKYPNTVIIDKRKLEKTLINFLTINACSVYWNTELKHFEWIDNQYSLAIISHQKTIKGKAKWLIGADGKFSLIREKLNHFNSQPYETNQWFNVNIKTSQSIDTHSVHVFLFENSQISLIPTGAYSYLIRGKVPKYLVQKESITYQDLNPFVLLTTGKVIEEKSIQNFKINTEEAYQSEIISSENSFIIGNASISYNNLWGLKIGNAIYQANNLAWKLAGFIKGNLKREVLITFSQEVLSNQSSIKQTINKQSQRWIHLLFSKWLKKEINPIKIYDQLSQFHINFRQSPLSINHSTLEHLKAGDRLPNLKFYDEKKQVDVWLHESLSLNSFTLLLIGNLSNAELFLIAKWLKTNVKYHVSLYYIPHSKRNEHLFNYFELTAKNRKSLLIRPDLHIAYLSDSIIIEMLDNYFQQILNA